MEHITGRYTIKQIFQDWWEVYVSTHPLIRDYVHDNVRKMLSCRDPERLGYRKAVCPTHPDQFKIIPHSCKSRFCNSCGKIAVDKWLVSACEAFPNVPYAHVTWTVPSELRPLLKDHPEHCKALVSSSYPYVGVGWWTRCRDEVSLGN